MLEDDVRRVRRCEVPWNEIRQAATLRRLENARTAPRRRSRLAPLVLVFGALAVMTVFALWKTRANPVVTPATPIDVQASSAGPASSQGAGETVLRLADGSVARQTDGAHVQIQGVDEERTELLQTQGDRKVRGCTECGEAVHVVRVRDAPDVSVLGTLFRVQVEPQSVVVHVERGQVEVAQQERRVKLNAGEGIMLETSDAPSDRSAASSPSPSASQAYEGPAPPTSATPAGARSADRSAPVASPLQLLDLADRARVHGDLAEAATALRELLKQYPNDTRFALAEFMLGRVESARGSNGEAARAFAACVARSPGGALGEDALAEWAKGSSRARATGSRRRPQRDSTLPRTPGASIDGPCSASSMETTEAVLRGRWGPRATGTAILAALSCSMAWSAAAEPLPTQARENVPDERAIEVAENACTKVDVSRLRSLFALEVRSVVDRVKPVTLVVTCDGDRTGLRIESPRFGFAERSVVGALDGAEAERLLALAAAQLVFAAWLDMQPQGTSPREESALGDAQARTEVPAPAPSPSSARTAQQTLHIVDAGLEAGAVARPLGALAAGPSAALLATAWLRSWGVELYVGVNRTTIARPLGSAELVVGELGLGAAWRSSGERPFGLEVSAGPALAALDLRGIAPAAHVAAGSVTGLTMDGRAAVGPEEYRSGGLWILGRFESGYLVSGPEGTITAGDSAIAARGPWAGASLGAGGAW